VIRRKRQVEDPSNFWKTGFHAPPQPNGVFCCPTPDKSIRFKEIEVVHDTRREWWHKREEEVKLKKYLDRVPVGSELVLSCHPTCPECQRSKGEVHTFGCVHEECPECRKIVIGCHCNCLSPSDAEKIIKALHDQFLTLADAVEVVTTPRAEPGQDASYLIHAAMQYLYENVPSAIREDLNRGFQESHPSLVPMLQDAAGYGYYTAEQLSVALQISLAEVHEKIDAMVAAGQGIRFGNGIRLRKVN
jgi:hypothetical protein